MLSQPHRGNTAAAARLSKPSRVGPQPKTVLVCRATHCVNCAPRNRSPTGWGGALGMGAALAPGVSCVSTRTSGDYSDTRAWTCQIDDIWFGWNARLLSTYDRETGSQVPSIHCMKGTCVSSIHCMRHCKSSIHGMGHCVYSVYCTSQYVPSYVV